jgi:hypothetical protein
LATRNFVGDVIPDTEAMICQVDRLTSRWMNAVNSAGKCKIFPLSAVENTGA